MADPLIAQATELLDENWRGTHTVPAGGLYPHQWSWDSAFIAIGLRHVAPDRARLELESLFSAQWADGRIPQIVFDQTQRSSYSPGPDFWRSEELTGSPKTARTTGLVQPPNHALAVWETYQAAAGPDGLAFLRRCYPPLVRWHEYLARRRTDGGVLAHIVHPWESGTDNSPLWDTALARLTARPRAEIQRPDLAHAVAGERPTGRDYRAYFALAERYRDHDCDDQDSDYPFVFQDPLFNSLLVASEFALAKIADTLGLSAAPHITRAREIASALDQLFDDRLGCYVARDVVTGSLVRCATVNGLVPLLCPGLEQAEAVLETLTGPRFLGSGAALVPSYDTTARDFDPALYWRGPAWFNMSWLIMTALREYDEGELAERLGETIVRMASASDFPEYVNPRTGEPHGTRRFSWTAALALDVRVCQTHPQLATHVST